LLASCFFPAAVIDSAGMEEIITASGLDWTIVRPPRLTNRPHSAKYRMSEGRLPLFGVSISRADLANATIAITEKHSASRKVVGVCQ
jgi:hypothetical protein